MGIACGGATPRADHPSPADERFSSKKWDQVLPAGAEGVLVVDLAAVASTNLLSPQLVGDIGPVTYFKSAGQRCGIGLDEVRRLVVAQYSGDRYAAILLGTIEEKLAAACLDQMLRSRGSQMRTSELQGRTAYFSSNERDRLWMSVPVTGVLIVTSKRSLLRDILDPATERNAGETSWLRERATELDTSRAAWAAWKLERDGQGADIMRALNFYRDLGEAREVFASVDLKDTMDLSIGFSFPDEPRAKHAHEFLQTTQSLVRLPPKLAELVASIRIAIAGRDVTISVSTTQQQLEMLFGTVTGKGHTPSGP